MSMADVKKKKQFIPADNPVEQLKDVGRDIAELPVAIFDTALEQIGLKPQKKPLSGEFNLSANTQTNTQETEKKDAQLDRKAQTLRAVQNQGKELNLAKQKAVQEQIQKLLMELRQEVMKLEQKTADLSGDVKKITVETAPAKGGVYHLNFLDMVLFMLRDLQKRVGESRQWLALSAQKKQQKGYWQMFKKHGNNFAMSDERAVASANG